MRSHRRVWYDHWKGWANSWSLSEGGSLLSDIPTHSDDDRADISNVDAQTINQWEGGRLPEGYLREEDDLYEEDVECR